MISRYFIEEFIANNPYQTLVDLEDERNSRFVLGVFWHFSKIGGTTYVEFDSSRVKEEKVRQTVLTKNLQSMHSVTQLRNDLVNLNLWKGKYGRWISIPPKHTMPFIITQFSKAVTCHEWYPAGGASWFKEESRNFNATCRENSLTYVI